VNKKTYSGLLSLHKNGEAYNILYLSSLSEPLAEELEIINKKQVNVKYWISDTEITEEKAVDITVREAEGLCEANYCDRYSEYTGYLWTDEDLMIGGHDLIREFNECIGKWLRLEIEIC